jgi:hypothetical protein
VLDLDPLPGEVDPEGMQPQQLARAQPGADLDQEVVAVERRAGGQEAGELLRRVGTAPDGAEDDLGSTGRFGAATRLIGLNANSRSSTAACRIRLSSDRHAVTVG